jgi:methylated-DNA-protein-cysteine methyltransferase-like protein
MRGGAESRRKHRPSRFGERVHGDVRGKRSLLWKAVYDIARRIPAGRVMTYGQISLLLENALSPRAVGWALHGCPDDVPWQRVVNAQGGCSTDRMPDIPTGLQRALLEAEGVEFGQGETLDLARYRYEPPSKARRPALRAGTRRR